MRPSLLASLMILSLGLPHWAAAMERVPGVEGVFGAGLGYLQARESDFLGEGERFSDSRVAMKVFIGADYRRVIGVELAYIDFGRASDGDSRLDARGWAPAALASLPLTTDLAVYGKAGQLFWKTDRRTADARGSDDGSDFFYGGGVRYAVTDHMDLRLEHERFELRNADLDLTTIQMQARF